MSNEELAVAIQDGQTDLTPILWEQIERFVYVRAVAWKRAFETRADFDIEDLVQSGWFAMLDAIKYFDADKGHKFLTIFSLLLKTQFQRVIGIQSSKRDAALYASLSLDCPINADEPAGTTIGDTIPDPDSEKGFDEVVERLTRDHIRSTMNTVATEALTVKQREVYDAMLQELRCADVAGISGITTQGAYVRRNEMLEILRGDPRILQLWFDLTEQEESAAEVIYRYASNAGPKTFHETGASCVEKSVERILQNEQRRRGKRRKLAAALEERLHEAAEADARRKHRMQRQQMTDDLKAFERSRSERLTGDNGGTI